MRWAVAVALLALALPGCECGPTYEELSWDDPALVALLERTDPPAATRIPAAGALPWNGTWNGTDAWAGIRLSAVSLALPPPPGERRGMFADVQPPRVESAGVDGEGDIVATVAGDAPEADLRAAFDRVLANTTEGLDAEATWQAFLASRRDSGMAYGIPLDDEGREFEERTVWAYSADVRGHLRLDAFAAELGLPAPTPGLHSAEAAAGGWSFSFGLPAWTLHGGKPMGGGTGTLDVDAAGHARMQGPFRSEQALRQAALDAAHSVGHEPDLSAAQASASIC